MFWKTITLFTVLVSLSSVHARISHGARCNYTSSLLMPKSNDCSTFLKCVKGRWRDYKCPAGGVFNPATGLCTWPQTRLGCKVPTTNPANLVEVKEECIYPCPIDGRRFLYPQWGDCSRFYYCSERVLYSGSCRDIPPAGTYRYFNFFMFSCDRQLETNNVCKKGKSLW